MCQDCQQWFVSVYPTKKIQVLCCLHLMTMHCILQNNLAEEEYVYLDKMHLVLADLSSGHAPETHETQ